LKIGDGSGDDHMTNRLAFRNNSTFRRILYAHGLVLLLIGNFLTDLKADSIGVFETRVNVQALSSQESDFDSGFQPGNLNHSVNASSCIPGFGCSAAFASASTSPGILGASATASGEIYAAAGGQAFFNDFLTFSGAGLAYGTPVDVLPIVTLDGTLDGAGSNYSGTVAGVFGQSYSIRCIGSPGENVSDCNYDSVNVLHLAVGPTFLISAQLTALASSANDSFVNVSFSSTAHYYLDILTPGVTLQSASGYSYQLTAVPETATLPSVALGLIFLVLGGRIASQTRLRRAQSARVSIVL
jgi:hypothetical protein